MLAGALTKGKKEKQQNADTRKGFQNAEVRRNQNEDKSFICALNN